MNNRLLYKLLYQLFYGLVYFCSVQEACASSASIERVFSTFGLVHSKLRNRLGIEKAAKLVFCFRQQGLFEIDEH